MLIRKSLLERFEEKYIPEPNSGCWLWIGARNEFGYGITFYNGKNMKAHRASYLLFNGSIPDGMLILHNCDNKSCVNPTHLRLGTHTDNMRDMVSRNRQYKGEAHHLTTLNSSLIAKIRDLYKNYSLSQKEIAKMFGLNQSSVSRIVNHKNWSYN